MTTEREDLDRRKRLGRPRRGSRKLLAVGCRLSPEVVAWIDAERGDLSASAFVQQTLEALRSQAIENEATD